MMVTMVSGQATYRGAALSARPDGCREQFQNLLGELRQDPRFDEWCHLTSALGLGGMTLRALADLHDGVAEALIPELGNWDAPRRADPGVQSGPVLLGADGAGDGLADGQVLAPALVPGYLPAPPPLVREVPAQWVGFEGRTGVAAS
jgi:hypothetical protein